MTYDESILLADAPPVATPVAATTRPCIAPFALLRMATVPIGALDALRPAGCIAAIERAEAAEQAQAAQVAPLTEELFGLVSRIAADDADFRRSVLQLKRGVHNGSSPRLDDAALERIAQGLRPEGARCLALWRRALADRVAAERSAEQALAADVAGTLRPSLRALLDNPPFRHALALAAPGLLAHAVRERGPSGKALPDKFERGLLAYAIRAGAKTSPFSSFMSTTVVDVANGLPGSMAIANAAIASRIRLSRGVLARIAVAATASGRHQRALHVNPTLASVGAHRFRLFQDRLVILLGRPWRQQNRTHFQLQEILSRVLLAQAAPTSAAGWRERFVAAGIEPERATTLVPQLLERAILQASLPWDAFDHAPERALLAMLASEVTPGPRAACERIEGMVVTCDGMDAHGDTALVDRTVGNERIRALEAEALSSLASGQTEPLQNVVVEDTWSHGFTVDAPRETSMAALGDLSGFLATQIGVSPPYRRLRAAFLARFGEDGHCTNVPEFLSEAAGQLAAPTEFGSRQDDGIDLAAPVGARLAVTLQVQAIADGSTGGPTLVVNKVYENAAWLAARFGVGGTREHAQLRDGLVRWLDEVAQGREPVDVPVCGECNDLQAHPRLTRRVLRLPGEPFVGDGSLALGDLRLRDDASRSELVLTDCTGREIQPFYMGGTLPSPTWGLPYAVVVLSQPYGLMRPAWQPPARAAQDVEFTPRMTVGRAVVRRAMWWVSTDYLRRAWFSEEGARQIAAVRRELRGHGMPTCFFARRPLQASTAAVPANVLDGNRKPLWVDACNPFCLALLERLCQGAEWISLTEALPAQADAWLRIDGVPHVSELQIELLLRRGDR